MTRIALTTALIATIAAPPFEDDSMKFAVGQFNQSYDSVSEVITLPATDVGVTVSSRSTLITDVQDRLNQSYDSVSDIQAGGTIFASEPAFAADIFEATPCRLIPATPQRHSCRFHAAP
jgi:hypothetical protein